MRSTGVVSSAQNLFEGEYLESVSTEEHVGIP